MARLSCRAAAAKCTGMASASPRIESGWARAAAAWFPAYHRLRGAVRETRHGRARRRSGCARVRGGAFYDMSHDTGGLPSHSAFDGEDSEDFHRLGTRFPLARISHGAGCIEAANHR